MVLARISTSHASGQESLPVLRAWSLPSLVHGFMTRDGGVSHGSYRSLNLSDTVGDDPFAVTENWRRWHAIFPHIGVVRLQQVHGNRVHRIEFDSGERRIGDGLVTAEPGIVLAIFTADCVPVLMVDGERRVCGAVHAGWRGTLAGIAAEGVNAIAELGARPDHLRVALGPSIGGCCFEVDEELADSFVSEVPVAAASCRASRRGKKYLDLRAILRSQFLKAGVASDSIINVGPCTRCNSHRFFSRRAAGSAPTGLQMSFVGFEVEQ